MLACLNGHSNVGEMQAGTDIQAKIQLGSIALMVAW
eukprot:gene21977-8588_t